MTAIRPPDADADPGAARFTDGGPLCGLCPEPAEAAEAAAATEPAEPAEPAFGCESCDDPVCGYCADDDVERWLCPECGRRALLA